jgi:Ca-activated chloride channel family protein
MQFQSLGALLWFLPVAGFIILLYLLKVRRREVRVPAKFLFPAITTDVRANNGCTRTCCCFCNCWRRCCC